MFQPVALRRMGQMAFQMPQMGPSMSPAFVFATGNQAVPPMPTAPGTTPAAPIPPPGAMTPPPTPGPATASYGNLLGPALIVLAVGIIVGVTA